MSSSPPAPLDTLGKRLRYAYGLHPGAYRNDDTAFSLRELDRLAGVGEGLASQVIAERATNPTVNTLRGFAGVLGCSVGWLSEGEGAAPKKGAVVAAVGEARRAARVDGEEAGR